MVSRSHEDNLNRFTGGHSQCEFIAMGSSLKSCLLAEGAAHLYPRIRPTMEWDTAAAHCILEVAGGSIAYMDGLPLTYSKPRLLNPCFLASILSGEGDVELTFRFRRRLRHIELRLVDQSRRQSQQICLYTSFARTSKQEQGN